MTAQETAKQSETKEVSGIKNDPCEASQAEQPDLDTLIAWEADGGCEAVDGCWVEPDGTCSHGCSSWLLVLGFI